MSVEAVSVRGINRDVQKEFDRRKLLAMLSFVEEIDTWRRSTSACLTARCKPIVANERKSLASSHTKEQDRALSSEDERVRSTRGKVIYGIEHSRCLYVSVTM